MIKICSLQVLYNLIIPPPLKIPAGFSTALKLVVTHWYKLSVKRSGDLLKTVIKKKQKQKQQNTGASLMLSSDFRIRILITITVYTMRTQKRVEEYQNIVEQTIAVRRCIL